MKYILLLFLIAVSLFSVAQNSGTLTGTVIDNQNLEPVIGAKIKIGNFRATTDLDGVYEISGIPYGEYELVTTMLSFDSVVFVILISEPNVRQDIYLGTVMEVEETTIIAAIAQDRKTPVAVTTLDKKEIQQELGSRDLPMILNSKPGVYATQQGGGDGDARITLRGFDQRNIGVMIDGVPVNDMENGQVYWSNWFGLDAITKQIQIQRGLSATKISMPSVGGTMNILTDNTAGDQEIKFQQEYGSGTFLRSSISYKSGTLKNGWGVLASGSYKNGNGWVDGLQTEGAFYYLKVQKKYKEHIISLSGFGAPQRHGQRSFAQPISYWDKEYGRKLFKGSDELYDYLVYYNQNKNSISSEQYNNDLKSYSLDSNSVQKYFVDFVDTTGAENLGRRYNQHYGYIPVAGVGDSVVLNERSNYYHKPQITLRDFWKISNRMSWTNVLYASIGRGGGTRARNPSALIYNEERTIDWVQIIDNNRYKQLFGQIFSTADATYDPTKFKSSQILTSSVNNHNWYGGISQVDLKLSEYLDFSGGIDYRFYKGEHYVQITDLLGGDYFVNDANQNDTSSMKVVGDKIGWYPYHNHRVGYVAWLGGYGQLEYSKDKLTTFVNISVVTNTYKGIDYFQKKELHVDGQIFYVGANDTLNYNGKTYTNDSPDLIYNQTDWTTKLGATFKAGLNYNFTDKSNAFINLGYLSRTPLYSNVIDNGTNRYFEEIVNENIYAFEAGYGFRSKKFSANLNSYFTYWQNKPFPFGVQVPDPNDPTTFVTANVNGMDALHMGIEFDGVYTLTKTLSLEGMASYGDWTWQSAETIDVVGTKFTFDAKGVHVGDAAQSSYALSLNQKYGKGGYFKVRYTYFDRNYSNFDPFSLKGANAGRDSWQIPDYGLLSLHTGYNFKFKNKNVFSVRGNIYNLLNTTYISDATNNRNGSDFNANSATVYLGPGLTFNVAVSYEF